MLVDLLTVVILLVVQLPAWESDENADLNKNSVRLSVRLYTEKGTW